MKKIAKYTILYLFISTLFFSCDDFIERDIKTDKISLLAPGNNLTTIQLTQTFWWDWMEGAEAYNMQLVEGTFSSVTKFVLDTTINQNKFSVTLYPGSFQWRVRGENNGGVSDYSTFNFVIDSTLNISSLQVVLSSPTDNFITNNDNVTFVWNSLLNADDYLVEVHQNTWTGSVAFGPQITSSTTLSTILPEGTFVWGIQARNATSATSTTFSTRTLTIDTTSPNVVTLILPADNAILSDVYNTYSWSQGANTGTALTDDIYFYSDLAATTLIKTAQAVGTSYQDSLGVGTYYWRVQSTDAATNVGPFSVVRKVVIQ